MNSICRLGTAAQLSAQVQAASQAAMVAQLPVSLPVAYPGALPNTIQDSNIILLVAGAGYTELVPATLGASLWVQFINTDTAAGANEIDLGLGAPGAEVLLMHFNVPALAQLGWNLLNAPLNIPIGTRISAQATLVNANVELHIFYRV
ncbi:MAG: hypothetical protein WC329_04430 [Candidatus Omnitrophota bacterium]|jgi:hypothetical protein